MDIDKTRLLLTDPGLNDRPYQLDALLSIFPLEKCLVKMFCGTGKSRIITNLMIHEQKALNVVVFPSLALISQYTSDYLQHGNYRRYFQNTLNVSSLKEEENAKKDDKDICSRMKITTNTDEIKHFLTGGGGSNGSTGSKVILVTYQSYAVLLDCLDGQKIGLVCYDEAHHVTSVETQKLVFNTPYFEKEVFFTATPRNANGITMFDRDEPEMNQCGPVAYDYTYLQGLRDEVLNQFEVCVDMYTENTTTSIYEAMARAILTRKTSRVLSFHAGVNGESNTSVWKFVDQSAFQVALKKIQEKEFPERSGYYTRVTFVGMDGNTPAAVRKTLLADLDRTPENEIFIISSCETIGEGVDTKRANMCVFADPKTSIVKIIQNIGRIVRRNPAHPLSTVLIPCWINMENYASAQGDRVKQDELIREQMRSDKGDYAGILNVLGALRQEDPEMYDTCLNYPNRRVKETSLAKQGFAITPDEGEGYTSGEGYTPEQVQHMKDHDARPLEIHTNETIERFNEDSPDKMLRLYKDDADDLYKPIERINQVEGVDDRESIESPPKKASSSVKMSIHQNSDIQMLWGVTGDLDFSKKFCTVVISCEVSIGVEQWRATHQAVCDYMDSNGKAPSTIDKDPAVKKLGQWVSSTKTNYTKNVYIMANPEIRAEWAATLEKYPCLADGVEQWRANNQAVCDYMDSTGKPPNQRDKNPEVKKLGIWVSHTKTNYTKNAQIMSNPEIRAEWAATLVKYRTYLITYLDAQWRATHQAVCDYMDSTGKRPSETDKNPEIKKLGIWVSHTKTNYTKNAYIMASNPEIRAEWAATLVKYRAYLKQEVQPAVIPLVTPPIEEDQTGGVKRKSPESDMPPPIKKVKLKVKPMEDQASPPQTPSLLTAEKRKRVIKPKAPKAYADLTDAERQRICETHLKKRQEEKGYRSTNPDDKDTINSLFAANIPAGPGKVIFLDHTEFKTAFALLEAGVVKPEDMLIPQRADNFPTMAAHEVFGSSVRLGEFNDVLGQYLMEGGHVKGVYADYCSTLEKDGLPFLDLLEPFKAQLTPAAVIGVTITLRNPEGVRYAGQDIAIMEKRIYRQFSTGVNLFHQVGIIPDDGPYTYGGGAPMATWLLKLN
jgi:superfamily II DNA or RNA helicase